jgi:hypothetical protein
MARYRNEEGVKRDSDGIKTGIREMTRRLRTVRGLILSCFSTLVGTVFLDFGVGFGITCQGVHSWDRVVVRSC